MTKEKKTYNCGLCNESFSAPGALRKHRRRVHTVEALVTLGECIYFLSLLLSF